ncbi:MAG: hypothetical protein ISP90_16755 [Nevskia sp.]|nr:hypothetical protein [Nevskia sp.]
MGAINRILRGVGATSLKRQLRSDDRLMFMLAGEQWVVHEPWGDNSRYWVGPKNVNRPGYLGGSNS